MGWEITARSQKGRELRTIEIAIAIYISSPRFWTTPLSSQMLIAGEYCQNFDVPVIVDVRHLPRMHTEGTPKRPDQTPLTTFWTSLWLEKGLASATAAISRASRH